MTAVLSDEFEIPIKPLSARFRLIQELGSGSFGTVSLYKMSNDVFQHQLKEMKEYQGTMLSPLSILHKYNNGLVAIKTMNKKLKRKADYSRIKEIQFIFSVSSHFNLVQIIDVFIDRTYMKLNIVMENMDQNLYQLMKARNGAVFSPRTLKSVLSQLLNAISHIHKHLFFHRDVKPENILVMQNLNYFGTRSNIPPSQREHSYIIKLADYGLARHETNKKQFTAYVSTRWYRSPEILFRNQYYSYPIDIWAFGCVAVECATFYPLFPGRNELDQCCKIMEFLGNPSKNFQLMALQSMNKPDVKSEVYNDFSYKPGYNYQSYSMIPFGGFWPDATPLAAKLGLMFPKHFGYRLENLIKRTDFTQQQTFEFFQMVKSCLTWDPARRAKSQDLINCPYFKDCILDLENQKENLATVDPALVCSTSTNKNMKKSMIFAGISPTKSISIKNENINPKKIMLNKLKPGLGIQNKPNISGSNILGNFGHRKMVKESSVSSSIINSSMNSTSNPVDGYADIILENDHNNPTTHMYPEDSFSSISNAIDREINLENLEVSHTLTNLKNIPLHEETTKEPKLKDGICSYNLNYLILESEDLIDKTEISSSQVAAEPEEGCDDCDESEESEEDLIPPEYNNVSILLDDSTDRLKLKNANIAIKSRTEGNYDLIDAINYALDDELN